MIFLDESGVDKGNNTNSPFFVVSVVNLLDHESENNKIRDILKHKQERLKWQKLTKEEKSKFFEYAKGIKYKIDCVYNKKENIEASYLNLLYLILSKNSYNKEKIIYEGLHLNSIFEKVRKLLKIKNRILISFRESEDNEKLGIQIADLWAGFINHSLKKKIDISEIKNLNLTEYQ